MFAGICADRLTDLTRSGTLAQDSTIELHAKVRDIRTSAAGYIDDLTSLFDEGDLHIAAADHDVIAIIHGLDELCKEDRSKRSIAGHEG